MTIETHNIIFHKSSKKGIMYVMCSFQTCSNYFQLLFFLLLFFELFLVLGCLKVLLTGLSIRFLLALYCRLCCLLLFLWFCRRTKKIEKEKVKVTSE